MCSVIAERTTVAEVIGALDECSSICCCTSSNCRCCVCYQAVESFIEECSAREAEQRNKVESHFDKLAAALAHRSVSVTMLLH